MTGNGAGILTLYEATRLYLDGAVSKLEVIAGFLETRGGDYQSVLRQVPELQGRGDPDKTQAFTNVTRNIVLGVKKELQDYVLSYNTLYSAAAEDTTSLLSDLEREIGVVLEERSIGQKNPDQDQPLLALWVQYFDKEGVLEASQQIVDRNDSRREEAWLYHPLQYTNLLLSLRQATGRIFHKLRR